MASTLMLLALAATAMAQSERLKYIELCNGVDRKSPDVVDRASLDVQIGGCTALIDAGRQAGDKLRLMAIAHNNRGNAYTSKGEYDRAIRDYDQSIKIEPDNPRAFNNRGVVYQIKGEHDRAIEDFDQAIKLTPTYASPFANRAESYRNKGEFQRAARDYDEAIRLTRAEHRTIIVGDSITPQSPSHVVWNGRCWVRAIVGELQAALADCNEAIRLRPDFAAALDSRGFTYLKLGQLERAIADFDAALRLDPRLANALYGRGLAKLKKGDEAGGNADIAAAKAIEENIAGTFVSYGVR